MRRYCIGRAAIAGSLWIASFAVIYSGIATPVLTASRGVPSVLSWPTNVPSFGIQTRTNLFAGAPWTNWPMQPVIIGTNFVVTNTFGDTCRFFRLSNWPQRACENNLKQIAIAIRIWGVDNSDRYPFHVPISQGGTMELREIGPDGFDTNTYLHFQVMSNELTTPTILVCPGDLSRQPAPNFQLLEPENVTYRLRTDDTVSDTNPDAALAVCPIDGNTLYCSGYVTNGANY